MNYLNCYICNGKTKLQTSIRIKSRTKYSNTKIHEIIQSFLKETHMLRFSPNDIVCERCYRKINQYDLACRMADEIQKDITNSLYITEQEYLSEEPVEYLEDGQNDISSCQKDFEQFQEKFDVENAIEHVQIDASNDEANTSSKTEPIDMDEDVLIITSTMESIETDDDGLVTDGEREHKSTKRRGYSSCEDCDIPFVTKKQLKQHQLRYHTQKKCGVCQQQFANQMELRAHTRQNHEIEHNSNDEAEESTAKDNEINFRCDICGIIESSTESLTEHIALHENQLKCVVCGTILKHKANLILHMRIHTDKKFFKCDKCEKTFVHKSSLRMHLQTTHTDVRKKQCPECPVRFKTTSQLNQHLVTHTGVKRHKCPECGKAFGQKYNMTAHYKSHFYNKVQRKARPQTATGSDGNIDDSQN